MNTVLAPLNARAEAAAPVTPAVRPDAEVTAGGRRPTFGQLALSLHNVAARVGADDALARPALRALIGQLQSHPDPRCTGLLVFASAMARRLACDTLDQANLYLRQFEVPQIQLFNLLGRHLPMAALATRVANDAIAHAIAGQAHPVLVDVGIGTGRQVISLLGDLAAAGRLPARLTVIGIEPSVTALSEARAALSALAAGLGVELDFQAHACAAEALTDADWRDMARVCSVASRPVINAAFALHHIADDAQGREQRNAVLHRLRALDPLCLVLGEPDVDHMEPVFLQRFRNCYAHFSAVFGVIDDLPVSQAERDALKVGFFGREIDDILSTPEAQRSERHESAASWFQRLAATGFRVRRPACPLPDSAHPGVEVALCGARTVIRAGGETVVSVIIAEPVGASV